MRKNVRKPFVRARNFFVFIATDIHALGEKAEIRINKQRIPDPFYRTQPGEGAQKNTDDCHGQGYLIDLIHTSISTAHKFLKSLHPLHVIVPLSFNTAFILSCRIVRLNRISVSSIIYWAYFLTFLKKNFRFYLLSIKRKEVSK